MLAVEGLAQHSDPVPLGPPENEAGQQPRWMATGLKQGLPWCHQEGVSLASLLRCGVFLAAACPQVKLWHHCMKRPCIVLVPAGPAPWAKGWPKVFHQRQFLTLEMVVW